MRELKCADAGLDCDKVMQAETDDEVMSQAAEHAREVHGMAEIDPHLDQKLRSLIHAA